MLPDWTLLARLCAFLRFLYRLATMNIATPYTAAPPTTPSPIPTEDALTLELDELSLPAAPSPLAVDVVAVFAELTVLPSPIADPAMRGIDGSSMPINVLTVASGLLYSCELGLRRANESGLTISEGIYAMASVVIYPSCDNVLYG